MGIQMTNGSIGFITFLPTVLIITIKVSFHMFRLASKSFILFITKYHVSLSPKFMMPMGLLQPHDLQGLIYIKCFWVIFGELHWCFWCVESHWFLFKMSRGHLIHAIG
eukprot:NODE_414_length_7911_cov_0.926011.p10 type:complete len:108 gc:universal NODE_414_length_7911_cov_0.926011:4557-4880(+)